VLLALGVRMKFVPILMFALIILPLQLYGKEACTERKIDTDIVYISCADYFSIKKIIPWNQKGMPSLRNSFLTVHAKNNEKIESHDVELLSIYEDIKRLSDAEVNILVPLDLPFYDLESSYHGSIVNLRLYEKAESTDEKGKIWLKDANILLKKMYFSIVVQIDPNKIG
jgi:hypothetical protein